MYRKFYNVLKLDVFSEANSLLLNWNIGMVEYWNVVKKWKLSVLYPFIESTVNKIITINQISH